MSGRAGGWARLNQRIDTWLAGPLPEAAARYHEVQATRVAPVHKALTVFALVAFVVFWYWDGVVHGDHAPAARSLRLLLAVPLAALAVAVFTSRGHLQRLAYIVFIGAVTGCIVAVTSTTAIGMAYALPSYLAIPLTVSPFFTRWVDLALVLLFTMLLPWVGLALGPAAPATTANYVFYLTLAASCAVLVFAVSERTRRRAHALHVRIRDLAHHDALTGLLTRRRFIELGEERVRDTPWMPCSLAYLDLDHFKSINDDLGHDAGDRALEATAAALRRHLPEGGLVARLGGEEFAVLLPMDDELAGVVCEEMLAAIRGVEIGDRALSTSIGLATRRPGEALSTLLTRADHALLAAKRGGRGRWCAAGAMEPAGTIAAP